MTVANSAASFSLCDLPTELLLIIISHIDHCHTLLSLSAVSRHFHAVVQPYLREGLAYRSIDWCSQDTMFSHPNEVDKSVCRLLGRILDWPILTTFVREIRADWEEHIWEGEAGEWEGQEDRLRRELARPGKERAQADLELVLLRGLEDMGLSPMPLANSGSHENTLLLAAEDHIVMLLSKLTELRKLEVFGVYPFPNAPVANFIRLMQLAATTRQYLPRLQEYTANHHDTENGMDLLYIIPAFGVPSMKKICGRTVAAGPVFAEYELLFTTIPDGSSGVEELVFETSNIPGSILEGILRLPKKLKSFSYGYGGESVNGEEFSAIEFGRAISVVSDSLESLTFEPYDRLGDMGLFSEEPDEETYPTGSRIGSLTHFTRLTHLSIPLLFLLGCEVADEQLTSQDINFLITARTAAGMGGWYGMRRVNKLGGELRNVPVLAELLPEGVEVVELTCVGEQSVTYDRGKSKQIEILGGQIEELAEKRKFQRLKMLKVVLNEAVGEGSLRRLEKAKTVAGEMGIKMVIVK